MSDGAADVRWLTYSEIAEALGIARESARQLVIRKHPVRRPVCQHAPSPARHGC